MQPFHIFSMVFGSYHIGLFKRACFRSLNWPRNKAALLNRDWHIYTKPEHYDELRELFKDSPFKLHLFGIDENLLIPGCGIVPTKQCDIGVILLAGLRNEVNFCIREKSRILFAPPDTIFGDGTVPNILATGSVPGTCVAVAHPRVLPSILDPIEYSGATDGSLSNAQLVNLSFEHAHDSWIQGEVGHKKNTTFMGGIAWKKLEPKVWSVQHLLPTHYLCDFNQDDWSFWWSINSFGAFDHRWPGECLVRQERQRLVGSSDSCFIVEITDWDKNVPDLVTFQNGVPPEDAYLTRLYHNGINKQSPVIFRGA